MLTSAKSEAAGLTCQYHHECNHTAGTSDFQGTDRRKGTEKQAVP